MYAKLSLAVLLCVIMMVVFESPAKGQEAKTMAKETYLYWSNLAPSLEGKTIVDFSYSPGLGFRDIDFHQITASTWPAMSSPTPEAVARVTIPANVSSAQLAEVIATLSKTAKYRQIEVVLQH